MQGNLQRGAGKEKAGEAEEEAASIHISRPSLKRRPFRIH
jgi:hypothetical protein